MTHDDDTPNSTLADWVRELSDLFNQVANFSNVGDFLGVVAEKATRLTQADGAMVLLMDDPESIESVATFGISSEYANIVTDPHRIAHTSSHANIRATWESGLPVLVSDTESDPRLSHWVVNTRKEGIRSIGSFPMRALGSTIGVINIYRRDPHVFADFESRLILTLADAATAGVRLSSWAIAKTEQVARLEELTSIQAREERLHTSLMDTVLARGGFDEISLLLQSELQGDILLEDSAGRLLSLVSERPRENTLRSTVLAIGTGRLKPDEELAISPVFRELVWTGPSPRSLFVRDVNLDGLPAARMWFSPPVCYEGVDLRRALDYGAMSVALTLLARTVEERDRQSSLSELCVSLINSATDADRENVRERAAHLGIDLSCRQFMLVASPRVPTAELQVYRVADDLRRVLPDEGLLNAVVSQSICLLVPESLASPAERESLTTQLTDALPNGWTIVVLGSTSIGGVGRNLSLALSVARSSKSSNQQASLIDVRDLGVLRLLYQVGDRDSLVAVRDFTIGRLLEYDAVHASDLVNTLRCYMDMNMKAKEVARALNIHPNTLRYRLGRIEEILQIELRSPRDLLNLEFGAQVHRVLMDAESD